MSTEDFRKFVDPSTAPQLKADQRRMTLEAYPPPLERLVGMWSRLSREQLVGMTSDGSVIADLYGFRSEKAPVAAATAAAKSWLASLSPEEREQVCFPVSSDLWRHWQNTPLLLRDPQVELGELSDRARHLALEVVKASLSSEGFRRSRAVMENNLFLGQLVGLTGVLNQWAFALSIFGEPSPTEPWGWQIFGHHLALNCLFIGDQMILSPVFMGVEPDAALGPSHRRLFEPHEKQALAVMQSLTQKQRSDATLYASMAAKDQPPGRFHPDDGRQQGGAFQDNRIVPYEGLAIGGLDARQRREMIALADIFLATMPQGPAEARLRDIERHLDASYFAWIGAADDVNPFYFRLHSPVALIEFDHHSGIFLSNEDPARFHVHTIVRSPNAGDYGLDLLRQHYASGNHGRNLGEGVARPPGHEHGPAGLNHSHGHSHDGGQTFHCHD